MSTRAKLPLPLELTPPDKVDQQFVYQDIMAEFARYYDPITQTTVIPDNVPTPPISGPTYCLAATVGGDTMRVADD